MAPRELRDKLQEHYATIGYVCGVEDTVVFQEETITIELQDEEGADTTAKEGWKVTRLNKLEMCQKDVIDESEPPRCMKITWKGDGQPQHLVKKLLLRGSEGSRFLTITLPLDKPGDGHQRRNPAGQLDECANEQQHSAPSQPTEESKFWIQCYYRCEQLSPAKVTVNFVVVPNQAALRRQQQAYEKDGYCSSPLDTIVFQEDTIKLELEDVDGDTAAGSEWKMTPINILEVSRSEVDYKPEPRSLSMTWTGEGKPQSLEKKLVLKGSKKSKFLTIRCPIVAPTMLSSILQLCKRYCQWWRQEPPPLPWCWRFLLLILFLVLMFGAYHWWFTGHISPGRQPCIIHSLGTLINRLSDITNTALFCHCMRLDKHVCDKIEKENQGDLWKQTREMAAAWFHGHTDKPSWKEVVETYQCMKMNLLAQEIKDQTGCF